MDVRNAANLVRLVRKFGFDVPELKEELFLNKGRIIRMGIEPNRIELLTEISRDFDDCYTRRVVGRIGGIRVSLISLPDLKINKRASGRNKDLADLDFLPNQDPNSKSAMEQSSRACDRRLARLCSTHLPCSRMRSTKRRPLPPQGY